MKTILLALALITVAPLAHAQIVIQAPSIPGVRVGPPGPAYPDDYWRHRQDEGRRDEGRRDEEWRRRAEFREEEHRKEEWQRAHCVRDYRGEEFCRR